MDAPARAVHPLILLGLVLVAVCGYLAGSRHVTSTPAREDLGGRARLVSSAGLLLEYPVEWEQAAHPATIPGLSLTGGIGLVPRGSSGAGLLVGQLPAGEPSPLPAAFLAQLGATPRTEVVNLLSAQAYRYAGLQVHGGPGSLDLYVVPSASGGAPRALACYAPQRLAAAAQQCERIVSSLSLVGSAPPSITPEPGYAARLAPLISSLDAARVRERAQMSASSSAAAVAAPARALAGGFGAASSAVSALEAPAAAAAAQAALARALGAAGSAYSRLATAATTESLGEYDSARQQVSEAETGVDEALRSFTLLGYGAA